MQQLAISDTKLSNYVLASDSLVKASTGFHGRVLFATRTSEMITVSEAFWSILQSNQISCLPQEVRVSLAEIGILVPVAENELNSIISENKQEIEENEVLYQVVQPTAWCQLGCTYCGQQHTRNQLSAANQEKFLGRVSQRLDQGKYQHLRIGWFGAEPLAGLSVIKELSPKLISIANGKGCTYSAKIVTNGMALRPQIADLLLSTCSITEAEVTIDGTAEHHDASRPTKLLRSTFDKIFSNVVAVAKNTELLLTIRCNVTASNAIAVPELIEMISSAGIANRVRFYTTPVYSWGNDAHKLSLTPEVYADLETNWLALQYRKGFSLALLPKRKKIVCMSVQRDAEVVDAHGVSFNCTEVPYVPAYTEQSAYQVKYSDSGKEELGILAKGLSSFNDRIISGEQQQCVNCKMLPVCGGRCPKAWSENYIPCPSAKLNITQRLNLAFAIGSTVLSAESQNE